MEEEEKTENEDDDQQSYTPPQPIRHEPVPPVQKTGNKYVDREAYLRRPPNQTITLIKSQFPNREAVVFFPYPPFLKVQRTLPNDMSRIV